MGRVVSRIIRGWDTCITCGYVCNGVERVCSSANDLGEVIWLKRGRRRNYKDIVCSGAGRVRATNTGSRLAAARGRRRRRLGAKHHINQDSRLAVQNEKMSPL
jgi:hypothetical protein